MKPTVPETGKVIRTEPGKAIVFLAGSGSCKGCGAAKIGLCKAGGTSLFLTAENRAGAETGDTVEVGVSTRVRWRGYLLAYLIPIFSLAGGTLAGDILGQMISFPPLDFLGGFACLLAASFISFRRLRRLDSSHSMEVKRVVLDPVFRETVETDEEKIFSRLGC